MSKAEIITRRIRLYGIVQGVGFRPQVRRLADGNGIKGSVANMGAFVEIIAQGKQDEVLNFISQIKNRTPERAVIQKMEVAAVQGSRIYPDFAIIRSAAAGGEIYISPDIATCDVCAKELFDPKNRRYLHPFINCTSCGPRLTILDGLPYDRERTSMKYFAMCPECAEEYHNPSSRRYDAQPVCCNNCGPEVYLLEKVYAGRGERQEGCRGLTGQQVQNMADRRREQAVHAERISWKHTVSGGAAITKTREIIMAGGIAAVKGIGGFHLCCDAKNSAAVQRLRRLKMRPAKPFAVMAKDIKTAERECIVDHAARELLTGHQKPILLLTRRKSAIADAVAPDNPKIGIMLPYAPVQMLLFRYPDGIEMTDVLVMTSGNMRGAPICLDDEAVERELSACADVVLSNNRAIRMRCDDSVMELYGRKPYMIRRSRGWAPLPVRVRPGADEILSAQTKRVPVILYEESGAPRYRTVLAIGGERKNTFCVRIGDLLYLSPYVGDLSDVRTEDALREAAAHFLHLLQVRPEAVICDMHPGYRSVKIAETFSHKMKIPLIRVQHHYAHVLSCMAENDCRENAIGVSFDGTGYGTDGTVWGGEILLASRHAFQRVGSIVPFVQPGGDAAARDGWRIAGAMILGLAEAGELSQPPEKSTVMHDADASSAGTGECSAQPEALMQKLGLCSPAEAQVLAAMYTGKINTAVSTSCGRLFDAAAAILGLRRSSSYEGEAANQLMFAAERYAEKSITDHLLPCAGPSHAALYAEGAAAECGSNGRGAAKNFIRKSQNGRFEIRTDLLIRDLISGRLAGTDVDFLAWSFHRKLADGILTCILALKEASVQKKNAFSGDGKFPNTVCLTGGCFQNTLLLSMTEELLENAGFKVLTHSLVPPNDGGLALGQALYGGADMQTGLL